MMHHLYRQERSNFFFQMGLAAALRMDLALVSDDLSESGHESAQLVGWGSPKGCLLEDIN